ncbi:hypothetical protein [Pandoraea pnomenusa]|uniref:hypothetical protein n=1 Tax=Pandoraea pnomenusa TaxID=93220 RepID=UPI00242B12A1|nr:hypothetical protein [Pandoraea pnomenusa]
MTYMNPRPEGLNTEKAPESIVEMLKMPDNKTVTFDALRLAFEKEHDMLALEWNPLGFYEDHLTQAYWEGAIWSAEHAPTAQSVGQEAVPVGRVQVGDGSITFIPDADAWRMGDEYEVFANAAPVNGGEREASMLTDNQRRVVQEAAKLLSAWLDEGSCECDGYGHSCGRPNVVRTRDELIELFLTPNSDTLRAADAPQPCSPFKCEAGQHDGILCADDDCDRANSVRPADAPQVDVNGGERELGQVIDERDQYHDAAEKLADAIAKHFGVEIGEHSNLNCPWQNALDHIAQATKRAADAQHSDDEAVDLFAQAMKAKMADARAKGRSGWETCDPADLSRMLREHVEKGDPRDVANFCMMLWHHRKPISAADAQQVGTSSFEFNHIGHEYTVYGEAAAIKALLQYRKHLEDVTANALNRAALTSPAKVGGYAQRRFETYLRSIWTQGYGCAKDEEGHYRDGNAQSLWECWRAALSADGGEKHLEADVGPLLCEAATTLPEGWEIVVEVENGYGGVNLIAPDKTETDFSGQDMLLSQQIRAAIDEAIAANQAKGDAS